MNLRLNHHNNRGYTLIELMITLMIFAIVSMFAVPAFYNFIEQSRAKSQVIKAANFLRSAQEIAISTNRVVYVYTAGYFDYAAHKDDYWYQDWIMSFKPIGDDYQTISQQDVALQDGSEKKPNPNYLIAQQSIFVPSNLYSVNVLDSKEHNAINRKKLTGSSVDIEMDGYSRVRDENVQGSTVGKPTYLVFYPSGALVMPVFVLDEHIVDVSFSNTKNWNSIKEEFNKPVGILAGCRMGRGINIDSINYTFNSETIAADNVIENSTNNRYDPAKQLPRIDSSPDISVKSYHSPPSFGELLCGSKFLQ